MRRLGIFLLLAGCAAVPEAAAPPAPQPVAVTLYRDTVTVSFRDGALCTAPRPNTSGSWSTTLQGCPHLWPVTVAEPIRRPRLPLGPTDGAPWVILQGPQGPLGYAPGAAAS